MGMNPENIRMDYCHIELIAATCAALKPKSILELGYGSGLVTKALWETIRKYAIQSAYTLVDNWQDHDGKIPYLPRLAPTKLDVITSTEEAYVFHAEDMYKSFDLIISDADHGKSHTWFNVVINHLLNPGGIGFFHDVCSEANLALNHKYCVDNKIPHFVFKNNSMPWERCDRGLLMVVKN